MSPRHGGRLQEAGALPLELRRARQLLGAAARTASTSSPRLWLNGEFEGSRLACSSRPEIFGGRETTALTLMAPLLHLGMVIVGVPYSNQELFTTTGGGSPYGPGHVAGGDNKRDIDENEGGPLPSLRQASRRNRSETQEVAAAPLVACWPPFVCRTIHSVCSPVAREAMSRRRVAVMESLQGRNPPVSTSLGDDGEEWTGDCRVPASGRF